MFLNYFSIKKLNKMDNKEEKKQQETLTEVQQYEIFLPVPTYEELRAEQDKFQQVVVPETKK